MDEPCTCVTSLNPWCQAERHIITKRLASHVRLAVPLGMAGSTTWLVRVEPYKELAASQDMRAIEAAEMLLRGTP
jgi:hypothetical protein